MTPSVTASAVALFFCDASRQTLIKWALQANYDRAAVGAAVADPRQDPARIRLPASQTNETKTQIFADRVSLAYLRGFLVISLLFGAANQ